LVSIGVVMIIGAGLVLRLGSAFDQTRTQSLE